MKQKVLITGGTGFIGNNLKEFLSKKYTVFAPTSRELDLTNSPLVEGYLKRHRFDQIIHCATHNATITSDKDRSLVFANNIRMFINIVRCSVYFRRMFYFGSGAEYHKQKMPGFVTEDFFGKFVPDNGYGFSKYIMANYIDSMKNVYDLRLFGCFGQYEDWRIRFIPNAICRAIHSMDITIVQNAYFDYLYVPDLVRIMDWFLQSNSLRFQHYNVCTGKTIDLRTLAGMVKKISNKRVSIIIKRQGLQRENSGDNRRLLAEMGNFSFTPIEVAIRKLFNWYQKREKLIDPTQFAR